MWELVQNILLTNEKLLARSVMVVENPITISLCADLKITLSRHKGNSTTEQNNAKQNQQRQSR